MITMNLMYDFINMTINLQPVTNAYEPTGATTKPQVVGVHRSHRCLLCQQGHRKLYLLINFYIIGDIYVLPGLNCTLHFSIRALFISMYLKYIDRVSKFILKQTNKSNYTLHTLIVIYQFIPHHCIAVYPLRY